MTAILLGLACLPFALARVAERGRGERGAPSIVIAPVGAAPLAVIERLVPAVRDAFGMEVRVGSPLRLPSSGYDPRRAQYLSTAILDALAAGAGGRSELVLGVADVDLYVPDLNFVFGEGDPRRRVAVFSLARLNSSRANLVEKRAATEAIHELGHACGLSHCDDSHCVMWFSNTLAESDRKGTRFCPSHAAQLQAQRARRRQAGTPR